MKKRTTKFLSMFLAGLCLVVCSCFVVPKAVAEDDKPSFSFLTPQDAETYLNNSGFISGKKAQDWKDGKYECYGDSGETIYCIEKTNGNKKDAGLYTRSKKRIGCEIISVSWNQRKNCKFCALLSAPYRAADEVTSRSFKAFSRSFSNLIVIIFAIWLAIKTLGHVSFLTAQDAAKYITDVLLQSFKFLLAYFALRYSSDVFNLLVMPIFKAGLGFAQQFVDVGQGTTDASMFDGLIDESQVANNKVYKADMYVMLQKFAFSVNMQFSLLQAISGSLTCLGKRFLTFFKAPKTGTEFGLGFNCLIYGLLFGVIGLLLSLAFVFYLFDAVVELGVFGAVLPFAIACWPFKMFTKAANNAVKLFMNSTFTFMMTGVAVKICMALISNALGSTTEGNAKGLDKLVEAVDTLDATMLRGLLGVISVSFLVFAFAGLGGFMMVGKISELTNKFAGGGLKSIAPGMATMAASGAKGAAQKLLGPTLKAGGKALGDAGKRVLHGGPLLSSNTKEALKSNLTSGLKPIGAALKPLAEKTMVGRGVVKVGQTVGKGVKTAGQAIAGTKTAQNIGKTLKVVGRGAKTVGKGLRRAKRIAIAGAKNIGVAAALIGTTGGVGAAVVGYKVIKDISRKVKGAKGGTGSAGSIR